MRAERELTWTLTTHGRTQRAFASLKSDYRIDKQVMSMEVGGDFGSQSDALRDNIPPVLEVEGPASAAASRPVQPVALVALRKETRTTSRPGAPRPAPGAADTQRRSGRQPGRRDGPVRPSVDRTGPADPGCGCRGWCTAVRRGT